MPLSIASIELAQLSKTYVDGSREHTVFESADFTFNKKTTYALQGSSGSGKTTLLMCIANLEQPSLGNVYYDNKSTKNFTFAQKQEHLQHTVGLLFQFPLLVPELNVRENILLKSALYKKETAALQEQADQLLAAVGLHDKATTEAWKLSGGQQQRVALARALINRPSFLLADEPTGNLDKATGERIISLIRECAQRWNMGVIISTHDQAVAQHMDVKLTLENKTLQRQ